MRSRFNDLTSSLEKSIDCLSTEFSIASIDFLPHAQQLVGLTYFFSLTNSPTIEQNKAIRQWFWNQAFSKGYSGQTDDKMNNDIAFFKAIARNDFSGLSRFQYTVDVHILIDEKFSKRSPYTRSLLLLQAQKEPLNLVNGAKVDYGSALSSYNRKEYHHIFPRTFLKNKGLATNEINSICNFCFLSADANKKISNKAPSDYFFNVIPQEEYSKILESNLMPLKKSIYESDDYEAFLKERARLTIQFLDKLLTD